MKILAGIGLFAIGFAVFCFGAFIGVKNADKITGRL